MQAKSQEQNIDIFNILDFFLKNRGIFCSEKQIIKYAEERRKTISFDLSRHIKGLVYSKLSNRKVWSTVEPKLKEVDALFFNYDISLMKKHDGRYFSNGIFSLKLGNIATKSQMSNLQHNISVLEKIDHIEGGLDKYYDSMPTKKLVKILSAHNSAYKLKYIGPALAWEYLRNVGIDGIKPDVHTRRIMGSSRLGYSTRQEATDTEVISFASEISIQTGLSLSMIDALLWSFCAEGEARVCIKTPNCGICPIVKYCNIHKYS